MNKNKLFILRFYYCVSCFFALLGLVSVINSAWDAGVIYIEVGLLTFAWMGLLYALPDENY